MTSAAAYWPYAWLRRSLGAVLFVNFASATPQLVRINRLQPVARLLARARRDARGRPSVACCRFPSLLWAFLLLRDDAEDADAEDAEAEEIRSSSMITPAGRQQGAAGGARGSCPSMEAPANTRRAANTAHDPLREGSSSSSSIQSSASSAAASPASSLPSSPFSCHEKRGTGWPSGAAMDRMACGIWAVGLLGGTAALAVAVLPGSSPLLFVVCWLCWLSFVNAFGALFWFPWDKLTCEIAFFGIFLPPSFSSSAGNDDLGTGESIRCYQLPAAQTRVLFQLLLFRVMFGMAWAKFRKLDDRSRDLTYIYHFLEWQPFPTSAARTLRDALPMALHKTSFVVFGAIELVLPFVALCARGTFLRRGCFAGLVGLQAMIMWTGNFGCFNIATGALCWPLLVDLDRAPHFLDAQMTAGNAVDLLCWALVAIHTLASLPFVLHTTSWDHGIWLHRPSQLPWWMPAKVAAVMRALEPLRLWNSYGVFISRGNVPHQVPVLQMKAHEGDDQWQDIEPHWLVCNPDEPPRRFAPHHPRIDHFLFYSNFKPEDMKLTCLDGTNPYYLSPYCLSEVLVTGLLSGDADAWHFFAQPRQQPYAVRHAAYHYYMLTPRERAKRIGGSVGLSGSAAAAFWRRELVGAGPAMTLASRKAFAELHNHGIRRTWETFVFDRFAMDADDALCIAGERLNPAGIAVVIPRGKEPPRSRSVVEKLANAEKKLHRS